MNFFSGQMRKFILESFYQSNFRWFFGGINRLKAEDYLKFDANVNGSYLIRACEKKDSNYCLSLKSFKNDDHTWVFKHYLILQNERKTQFWIKGAKE